ncbi:MAG: 3-dehydroquinate synthase [Clostridia bacterium]|nr:3-dehydroquinate synthase [Clostridia bacterium]
MTIRVKASKEYDVFVNNDLNALADYVFDGEKVAVITDENVNALYHDYFADYFVDKEVFTYVVKAGEESKSAAVYIDLLNKLARDGFNRKDLVVAFGGGVVGDLSGFVASTFMRGIKFISVPTTLLADVDSSVGGKTAINLDVGKNLCGTFYQPDGVYINVEFLKTLPSREIACGKGEIAKYSLLLGEKISLENMSDCIARCLRYKKEIVEKDEFEGGLRKLLNLGHTFGHAVEKYENYSLSHGECVGVGLRYALKISRILNGLTDGNVKAVEDILDYYGCPDRDYPYDELLSIVKHDKKGNASGVDMVLINKELKPIVQFVTFEQLKEISL